MSKHIHVLSINGVSTKSEKYTYKFGSTKDIQLIMSKDGISISAELTKLYDQEDLISDNSYLFSDAIKKALLLYLIRYNKMLEINLIMIKIDNDEKVMNFNKKSKPPIYSMITGTLQRPLSSAFSNKVVFEFLLNITKSKYDKRIASLFAFLCSKSKIYETERFIYLWTSFNGMYSWISEFVAVANGFDSYRKEYKQIIAFQQFIDVGNATIRDEDKTAIARTVMDILKDVDSEYVNRSQIEAEKISKRVKGVLKEKYNLTAYGYVLTQLSYYFRCKIVHGSKPFLLFSYEDDKELHCLKILNALLEEFIELNLPLWFDEKYIDEEIIPKTKRIILNK